MQELYLSRYKPERAPPGRIFGIVRSILYPIIFSVFFTVLYHYNKKEIDFSIVTPFILNIIANLLYTPIQFQRGIMWLATIDIIIVLTTIIRSMIVIYKHNKFLCRIQLPYLLWVSFATMLQVSIWRLNS